MRFNYFSDSPTYSLRPRNDYKTCQKKATEKMKLPVLACMIPGLVALSLIRKLHKLSIFK